MNFALRFFRLIARVGLACGIAALTLAAPAIRAQESAPPVVLPPFNVIESVLRVKIRIEYRQSYVGAFVVRMTVRTVKAGSVAEKAGLRKGTEIVAIQGHPVAGLSPEAVEQLMIQPVEDSLVLLVRQSREEQPVEVQLPVGGNPASP